MTPAQKLANKRAVEKKMRLGLCIYCGQAPAMENRTRCEKCYLLGNEKSRKRQARLKKAGACVICAGVPVPGLTRCQRCRETAAWCSIKLRYKITKDDYLAMYERQNGLCANKRCGKRGILPGTGSDFNGPLAVDHDHVTGAVRGLLCTACNQALGLLKDRSEVVEGLAEYRLRYS